MAYFRCSLGGGSGNGAVITVTYGAEFYNQTFVATNNVDTVSVVATSSGTADITVPSEGSWVVSCTIGADTYTSDTVVVDLTYSTSLTALPDGSIVTPTDDIQTWLRCAGITDKAYTTLAEVLADTDTYTTLLGDSNACDYMARSTTWASTIVADADAMRLLGMYDYACDDLLSDSTWASAIANSTYFESVLDVKVPTMTSNTVPSGVASASAIISVSYDAYKAFNGVWNSLDNYGWAANGTNIFAQGDWLEYEFTQSCVVTKVKVGYLVTGSLHDVYFKVQGYDADSSAWVDISSELHLVTTATSTVNIGDFSFNNSSSYTKYRIYITQNGANAAGQGLKAQFYGRHTAQTDIIRSAPSDTIYYMDNGSPVTLCTTDASGVGSVDWSDLPTGDITLYSSVAKNPTDLTTDYSKSIKVTKNKVEAWLMPNNTMYWWGGFINSEDVSTANGWTMPGTTIQPLTHNTNNVYSSTSSVSYQQSLGSANIVKGTKSKTIYAIVSGVSGTYKFMDVYDAKSITTSDTRYSISDTNVLTLVSYNPDTLQDGYPIIGTQSGTMTIYAFWYE